MPSEGTLLYMKEYKDGTKSFWNPYFHRMEYIRSDATDEKRKNIGATAGK